MNNVNNKFVGCLNKLVKTLEDINYN